jgi:hypothetical protein
MQGLFAVDEAQHCDIWNSRTQRIQRQRSIFFRIIDDQDFNDPPHGPGTVLTIVVAIQRMPCA